MVLQAQLPIILYSDINGVVAQSKDPRNHKGGKYIEWKYHLIREIVRHENVIVTKVTFVDNLTDPFTKALTFSTFQLHVDRMGVRCNIL